MLLTISTTHQPATDLGFLLHKNPGRHHVAEFGFGTAHVVYPEATDERCSAAVLVDIDPVGLVAGRHPAAASRFALAHYVNDRPYAASSFLSVALGRLFGTAMSGRSKERQELADRPIPLEASLPVVPCRGGQDLARRLFEPLGYAVEARALPLDPRFPEWGASRYLALRIAATVRLRNLLEHLFVLLPVLDDDKHYWVGADEVGKLLRRGGEWLAAHPEHDLITRRYLRHDQRLTRAALAALFADDAADPDRSDQEQDAGRGGGGAAGEPARAPPDRGAWRDHRQRRPQRARPRLRFRQAARRAGQGARAAADRGAGRLAPRPGGGRTTAPHSTAWRPGSGSGCELLHGSLTYRDSRLHGFDAAAVVEVIEHLDPPRIVAFEKVVFGHARPETVILTTPNAEYNALLTGLPAGSFRHGDHRFEWTRPQLRAWAEGVAARYGYRAELSGIGPQGTGPGGADLGCPTQLAVFRR